MRLEIDWTRCDGHGLCSRLLPELIGLDPDGFPVLRSKDVSDDVLEHAHRAVAACPRLAMRLERPAA
jgi:ferredoxin